MLPFDAEERLVALAAVRGLSVSAMAVTRGCDHLPNDPLTFSARAQSV